MVGFSITLPTALLAACGKPGPSENATKAVTEWHCAMMPAESDNQLSENEQDRIAMFMGGISLRESPNGEWSASEELEGGVIREHPIEAMSWGSRAESSGDSENLYLKWNRYHRDVVAHLYRQDNSRNIRSIEVKAPWDFLSKVPSKRNPKDPNRIRAVGVCLKQNVANPSKIPDDMK